MQVNGPEGQKLARKKSLAVSIACIAIQWPTPGLKGRAFKLCAVNRWDFNFCVRSSPLRSWPHVRHKHGSAHVFGRLFCHSYPISVRWVEIPPKDSLDCRTEMTTEWVECPVCACWLANRGLWLKSRRHPNYCLCSVATPSPTQHALSFTSEPNFSCSGSLWLQRVSALLWSRNLKWPLGVKLW